MRKAPGLLYGACDGSAAELRRKCCHALNNFKPHYTQVLKEQGAECEAVKHTSKQFRRIRALFNLGMVVNPVIKSGMAEKWLRHFAKMTL